MIINDRILVISSFSTSYHTNARLVILQQYLLPKLYKNITEVPGNPCSLQDGHSKIEPSPIS